MTTEPQKQNPAPSSPSQDPNQKALEQAQERQRQFLKDNPKEQEKADLLEKIAKIIGQYGGLESNIPITHEYWNLLGQYRGIGK